MKYPTLNVQNGLIRNIAVAFAYVATAKLGFVHVLEQTNATAVWPPTGIALAACLVFGFRIWPGIFLGAFLANILLLAQNSLPPAPALLLSCGTAAGNTLEAVIGAYLVTRFIPDRQYFNSAPDALRFILLGALLSPVVSATIGTAAFSIYSGDWSRCGRMWLTWWLGDAVGVLVFAPLLLTWRRRDSIKWDKKKAAEASAFLTLLLLAEICIFILNAPLEYLVFPIFFWSAFRFGQFEATLTVTLVMVTFLLWTDYGFGALASKPLNTALLFLQSYFGVASASTLLISTLINSRNRAEERLREYHGNLEKLVESRTAELRGVNEQLKGEIGEHARARKMLVEREAQYRDLVESANCVILRWLPDGRIIFFNRFARNFFGYSEEEIIHRNLVGTVIPTEDSSGRDLTSMPADIVAHPEVYAGNVNENIRKNGDRVWVAWTNKPILDYGGNIAEILSIGIDITQLVNTERELRRTLDELAVAKERAEAADQMKSAFLATMSHELRTPLNSIIGFTGILLQGLGGPLNEEQTKQLTMVKNSAHHLLSLISDILDLSKIESGQLKVSEEAFDLRTSIVKVVQSVRPLAEKKGLDLTLHVASDVGIVCADERRVEQIMLNLLSNAVKFTEQGTISIRCFREDGYYVTTVTDSGIGIHGDELGHLFKPFYQVDTGLSRKFEGTGLGLSICKKLVEIMGGTITVESSPGKGSTFSFTLPLERSFDEKKDSVYRG
jgi:PAS domain S-box-containing protein